MAVSRSGESTTWIARLRDRDHTSASLGGSLLVLSLPSIAMSLLGFATFQLIELRFLANLGDAAIAAAGSTNQTLRQVMMLMTMGLSVTTQMMIARLVGERSTDRAEHVAGQALLLAAALWAMGILSVGLFPEPFVRIVAHPDVVPLASLYARIVFLTLGVMTSVQLFSSILTGAGDTTTPMLIGLATMPISIFAEWVLAFGKLGMPELGIRGIALGAAAGGVCGLSASLWLLFSGRCRVHLRAHHVVPDPAFLVMLGRIAWQPALHMTARSLMVFFFMTVAASLGSEVQAAYTIGLRVEMIPVMIAFPLANACATLVGQNLGAGNTRRAWRSLFVTWGVAMTLLWPVAAALLTWRHEIAARFASDPAVSALASEYMLFNAAIISFYGIYFVSYRTLQAAGDMRVPMLISLGTALLIGAPLGYVLSRTELGATGMWIGNLTYAGVNCALTLGWLLTGRWVSRARPMIQTDSAPVPTG